MGDQEPLDSAHRVPETLGETILAHCKPQPAIPALFVFAISIFVPVISAGSGSATGDGGSIFLLLIPVGIVASCGLAIAAGFCSLFPTLAWIALATWAIRFTESGPLPGYNRLVLLAGIIAALAMFFVQVWRAKTGRFQPTIRIDTDN
jgi:hypothetical protein